MKDKKNSNNIALKYTGCILLFCAVAGLILLFWLERRVHYVPSDRIREEDLVVLFEEDYEAVLLSMYTPEFFDVDRFGYFLGISAVQALHPFVNLADIGDYLEKAFLSNNMLTRIYIGLDPFEISRLYGHHASLYSKDYGKYLTEYVQTHNSVLFEFLIPAYSIDYMRSLSDKEFTELIDAYRTLVDLYVSYDNVAIYFLGHEEWLAANPGNYVSPVNCSPSILQIMVAYTLRDSRYALTPENREKRFACMAELVQNSPVSYPDLSQWCMVFFGDSVFEYNAGSRSVPGVVEGLSGAQVYNCSKGGTSATENPRALMSLNRMITCFLEQDTEGLDEDNNFLIGLRDYMQESHEDKKLCFVVMFGLNDYFGGHPVENPEDSYDIGSYAGALRTGISTLKAAYPDAEILVLAPTYTAEFSGGTEKNSEVGGILTDYVDATVRVAEEMGVHCINNYADSGINADSQEKYLADGTHPNETGAFLLGTQIIEYMGRVTGYEE